MHDKLQQFVQLLSENIKSNTFLKLVISNKRNKTSDLKTVTVKYVTINAGERLSFVYRYPTKDVTKNYELAEGLDLISKFLIETFFQADLFTSTDVCHLLINKKNVANLKVKKSVSKAEAPTSHDKQKNRIISAENNIYLRELGVLNGDFAVRPSMNDKFRQINKYVEIIDGVVKSVDFGNSLNIVDMGSGKGYLTFALYDYFVNKLGLNPKIIGIELRKQLVDTCNSIAKKSLFNGLSFIAQRIEDADITNTDMLIALHACDTATDDAIYNGIKCGAKVIICAPCCHKQIRKQMAPNNILNQITKHGILLERQAEMVTDAIRARILEAYGYKTKVFQFIETEHTPKNVLIVAVKAKYMDAPDEEILKSIQELKSIFGIEYHYLEKLFVK